MKRLITFLALCCLMVTGVWAQALSSLTDLQDGIQVMIANKAHSDRYINLDATNAHFAASPTTFTLVGDNANGFKFYDAANRRYVGPTRGNEEQSSAVTSENEAGVFKMEVGSTGYFKIHCENPAVHSKGSVDANFEYLGWRNATSTLVTWTYSANTGDFLFTKVTTSDVPPITSTSELSNTKAYTITSYARGQWTAVNGKTEIYQTKGTDGNKWGSASDGYTPIDSDPTSANQQWAILKSSQNHYYLYNVGLKKFFVTSTSKATLADPPDNSTFTITDRADALTGDAKTNYTNSGNTVRFALSIEANSTTNYFGVTDWNGQQWKVFQNNGDYSKNSDKGMYFKIVPVEDFNPAEAMAKINAFEGVEPFTYILGAAGKPNCVTVTIEGNEISGTWAQGIEYKTYKQLSNTDVVVTTDDGYVATYTVDNNNHQINFDFDQIFVPVAHNGDLTTAKKYLIKNGDNYYIKYDNGNLPGTQTRSEADKYVFVKHATEKGKYYIYSVGAGKYLTYTATGNGSSTNVQTGSKVQLVASQADAKCWTFDNQICITPEDGGDAGLNFMGGADKGFVMNLFLNSDSNSKWQIIDGERGSLACAVTMFSKPGAEYMHKLIPEEGVTVTGLELLDGLTGLTLITDRQNKGNQYAYVRGTAPSKGVYHYNVLLSDNTKALVTLTVSDFLQAPTPGMVWVSWNWFESRINAEKLTAIADGLVAKGLVDAGYKTIVLDDAWGTGSKNGDTWIPSTLTNDTNKFPDMASFVQTINGKGIRVGLYSDASDHTCGNYQPGSIGVEADHVDMFERWGIDFLKYDFCGGSNAPQSYKTMGDAIADLNATREAEGNRVPFVFNACEWGENSPHLWGAESGTSMWRATDDARECWLGTKGFPGVLAGSDRVRTLWMYAGVNRFNDLDMMCIGLHGLGGPSNHVDGGSNGGHITGLTEEQARSQMSIWSMLASPLSLSCDVRETPAFEGNTNPGVAMPSPLVTESDLDILKNADIISISQDPLGQQAEYMASLGTANTKYQATGIDVYVKDMAEGKMALAVVNRNASGTATSQTISLNNIYLDGSKTYYVRDVWATSNKNFTVTDGQIVTGELAASQTKVYIISEEPFEEEAVTFVTTSTEESKTYYTIQNVRTMGKDSGANPAYVTAPSADATMTQANTVTEQAVWYFEDATAAVTDVTVLETYQPVYICNQAYNGYLSCPRKDSDAQASFSTTGDKQIFYLSKWSNGDNPNGYLCVTTEPRTTNTNTSNDRIAWADKNGNGENINYYYTQDGGTSFLIKEPVFFIGTHYVTFEGQQTSRPQHLYNDFTATSDSDKTFQATTQGTATNGKPKNNFVWKIVGDGQGGFTFVNGEGSTVIKADNKTFTSIFAEKHSITDHENAYFLKVNSTSNDCLNQKDSGDGCVVTTWQSNQGGGSALDNLWNINEVETSDVTIYTVQVTGCDKGYVTYDGQNAKNGGFFFVSGSEHPTVTAAPVLGYTPDITISDNVISVTYIPNNVTYTINITDNSGKLADPTSVNYVHNSTVETKQNEATITAPYGTLEISQIRSAYDYVGAEVSIEPDGETENFNVNVNYFTLYHPTWRANPETRPLTTGVLKEDGTWEGSVYMIFDSAIEGTTNRSGFEYANENRVAVTYEDANKVWALDNTTGTHLINNNHPSPFTFKAGAKYLWVIENAEGTVGEKVEHSTPYFLRNVVTGNYYNGYGNASTTKDDATHVFIQVYQEDGITRVSNSTHSYSQYTERVDAVTDDKGIFKIGAQVEGHAGSGGSGNCWNGDEIKFNNWENSHPFAFYQVVELFNAMDKETWDVCLDYAHYIDGVGDLSHDFGTFGEKTADSEALVVGIDTFSDYVEVVIENTKKYVRAPKPGRLLTIKNAHSQKYMNGADVTSDYNVMWYNSQNQIVSYNTGLGFVGVGAAELPEMDDAEFETHTADLPSFRLGTMVIQTKDGKFFSVADDKASVLCTNDANTTENSTWYVDNAPYVNVSFGSANNGYTTFLAPEPMIVPDGVTAYTVTKNEVEEDAEKGQKKECILTLTSIKASEDGNAYIPANTAVILQGTAGETVQVKSRLVPKDVTDKEYAELDKDWDGFIDTDALTTENVLKALDYSCVNPQYNGGTYTVGGQTKYIYTLAKGAFSYYIGQKIQAFKCFLALDNDYRAGSGNTAAFRIIFEDGTDAIHVIDALSNDDSNCFDLTGRRVQSNERGLLIKNGKKMLRK